MTISSLTIATILLSTLSTISITILQSIVKASLGVDSVVQLATTLKTTARRMITRLSIVSLAVNKATSLGPGNAQLGNNRLRRHSRLIPADLLNSRLGLLALNL